MRRQRTFGPLSCAGAARSHVLILLVAALFAWFSTQPPTPRPLLGQVQDAQAQRARGNPNPPAEEIPSQPVQEDLSEHQTRGHRPRTLSALSPQREVLLRQIPQIDRRCAGGRLRDVLAGPCRQGSPPIFLLHRQLRA